MAKSKYHFNPETLSYEKIRHSIWTRLKQIAIHAFTSFFLAIILFLIFVFTIESPYQKNLRKENDKILAQYKVLDKRLEDVQEVLQDLQQRDDNLYRVVFQAEPIPYAVRKGEYGGTNRYKYITDFTSSEIVLNTTKKATEINRQIYIQSKSFDEIVILAKNKEKMLECMPAIQPVLNKNLKHMASGYGMRIDPVYHTPKFHAGMDFAAPIGTKIFATGNGVVTSAGWKQGYGNCVEISHGFGYGTLYGHMSAIKTHPGAKVMRGDLIGYVGSTGKSTGPHLHYEVHVNGSPVNPSNYYFRDLSPADYDKMLQFTNNSAQVFD
jgi:murein DD-endopeptidase MepM/ murein hydrolase activator NlpD